MSSDNTEKKQKKMGAPEKYLFKSGVSGNPLGRPKGSKNFSTLFTEAIEKISKEKKLNIDDVEVQLIVNALMKALKGDYRFYKDIFDRRYGTPTQSNVNLNIDYEKSVDRIGDIIEDERRRRGLKKPR